MQLKLLHSVTTVKDDGTVEFEVSEDIESQSISVESEEILSNGDDESLDTADFHYIGPMQIVILIVGTRGDVQPFIPLGKRLQAIILFEMFNSHAFHFLYMSQIAFSYDWYY